MEPEMYSNKRKEANEREKKRMQHLNECYNRLREVFYWSFNLKSDRIRSKVQVLKDCLVYIRELEKRVAPHVLHDLQENFHHYMDKDPQFGIEEETTVGGGDGGDDNHGAIMGDGVKCATSCPRSQSDLINPSCSSDSHQAAQLIEHPHQLPRFEAAADHQYLSKRRKYVKTTCEYEVEYYPLNPMEPGYSLERKGLFPSAAGAAMDKQLLEYPNPCDRSYIVPPDSGRRYGNFNDQIPDHLTSS